MYKNRITVGTTYYENPEFIDLFISNHIDYVDEMIIVDDGSSLYPLTDHVVNHSKIKLYRVTKDYGFNSHGCRNLIMQESSNDWILLIDIDRTIVNADYAYESIKRRTLNPNTFYTFLVVDDKTPEYKPHYTVNDFLINKQLIAKVGGYDEEYIGMRCGDRDFYKQLISVGSWKFMNDVHVRLERLASVCKTDIIKSPKDIQPVDIKDIKEIVYQRIVKPDPNKPILTFDWERCV